MIAITQTCDGCGKGRPLDRTSDEHNGGWRTISEGKPRTHLCNDCISKALGRSTR